MNIHEFLQTPRCEVYNELPPVVVDVETTNHSKGDSRDPRNELLMLSVYDAERGKGWSYKCTIYTVPQWIIDRLEGDVVVVGQNLKFDLHWLANAGLDLTKVLMWDTMIAEKVLLGNNPMNLRLDLDSIATRRGFEGKSSLVSLLIKSGTCPSDIPSQWLKLYCEKDVLLAHEVYISQLAEASGTGKLGVVLTRCIFTPVLTYIEKQGLFPDKERVTEEWLKVSQELMGVERELAKIADINFGSPKQLAKLLYEDFKFDELKDLRGRVIQTATGQPKTGVDVVAKLKVRTKKQAKLKELLIKQSNLSSKLSKNLNKLKECADKGDMLYANFTQHIATTHRTTSTGFNYSMQLQNIPRAYKRMFTSHIPGWVVYECDGAGLEFRVAVELGNDKQGRIDLRDKSFDPHTTTASIIFSEDYDELKARLKADDKAASELRTQAKPHTFKPLYGGQSGTEDEQRYYQAFRERYTGISAAQEGWKREALETKKVRMPWGIEWYFPNTKITNSGYQTFSTNICNYPVQSFATADIIPIAVTYAWHEIQGRGLKALMVNTVHDSVIIVAPPEEIEELNDILLTAFTKSCYNYIYRVYGMVFSTPLGVGIKYGSHWGEGDELKIDVENDIVI